MKPTSRIAHIAPLLALVLALGGIPATADEEAEPGRLTLTTERVVVFKDGYGLFVKKATGIVNEAGLLFTEEVPDAAALGTFWAVADDALVAMRAEWIEEEHEKSEDVACASIHDLLEANVGVTVTLSSNLENRPRITGKILEVPSPQIVVVEVGSDQIGIPIASVLSVEAKLLGTKVRRTEEVKERTKRLSFLLGADAAGRETTVRILYFRPGIRWIPAYRLGGSLENDASLALQAEVLNEAEDLDGVPLHLVVGVPNFRFRDVESPLTLETAMRAALQSDTDPYLAAQLRSQNVFSNRLPSNILSNVDSAASGLEPPEGGGTMELAPELAAAGVQDLYVYDAPAITLPRGARATVPLFDATLPVKHLYTLDVKVERDGRGNRRLSSSRLPRGDRDRPGHLVRNEVWHQLQLANGSEMPWTTGAALLLQQGQPVAQEILGYTAPGATALLPITVATDIRAQAVENEADREPNAYRWGGYTWAEITVEGTIEVRSFRKEASRMRIRATVTGDADEPEDGTLAVRSGSGSINPESVLTWSFELPAGESRVLTYSYTFYTR